MTVRILALDSALGACGAALFAGETLCASRHEVLANGQAARLPVLVQQVLADRPKVDLVAATVGPGSFTGIRACLALAHGLAAAFGCPLVGVRVTEALEEGIAHPDGIWVAIGSRAGRVFLARHGVIGSFALDDLPPVVGRPVLLGNAAAAIVERLGDRFERHDRVFPGLTEIAAIGLRRFRGELPPLPAQPLYIDAPEAKRPGTA